MTDKEAREILEKYTNSSVHQGKRRVEANENGRIPRLSSVRNSEFPLITGFATDDEGTLEFRWFASHQLLITELGSWLAERSSAGQDEAPPAGLMQAVRNTSWHDEPMEYFESRMQSLIGETYPAFPLAWVGRFAVLCTSPDAFAEEVRLRFWSAATDQHLTSIITTNLYRDFAEFLDGLTEW